MIRRNASGAVVRAGTGGARFSTVRDLSRDVNRFWRSALNWSRPAALAGPTWLPEIDISEQDGEVIVTADLPGVDPGCVSVEIDHCALAIRGERPCPHHATRGYRRYERRSGSFLRRIALPEGVDPVHASASLRQGVLEIRIPLQETGPRRVPIALAAGDERATGICA